MMGDKCRAECSSGQHNNLLIAKEIAARHARLAWKGEWWTASLCIAEPLTLSAGDEYFARATGKLSRCSASSCNVDVCQLMHFMCGQCFMLTIGVQ